MAAGADPIDRPPAHRERRPPRSLPAIGWVGMVAVTGGYLLEAIRQRGDCDAGDPSPDTLAISVVLIVFVGGLCGVVGVVATLVGARRHRWGATTALRIALPAIVSLAGFLAIFLFAGGGPSTWFQHCGS